MHMCERMWECMRFCVCVPAHHQGLGQDVFDEFEVVALELLALGAGSLHLLIRIETEELGLVFELALLQDWGEKHNTACNQRTAADSNNDSNSTQLKVAGKKIVKVELMKGQKKAFSISFDHPLSLVH